ncbi:MAG: DNA internalization-related competence protein ComEC/Rec2 [Proteobacteria bacterium]|nr:DNA internalization-related competence protein ComEC/Rec2 [Pseudomonadota bacterium]
MRIQSGRFPLDAVFSVPAAIALLTGAVAVQALTVLPSREVMACVALLAVGTLLLRGRGRWLGFILLGAVWTMWRADAALSARLPVALEGVDVIVTGSVLGLPREQDGSARFDLLIHNAERDGDPVPVSGKLRLNWYDTAPTIAPCTQWRLHVRLKRPRGLVDPGAFDFERYALSEGIVATGYVREDAINAAIGTRTFCADGFRQRISLGIAATLGAGPQSDVLRALAFGDQQAMDEREWNVARSTGIPHLIAISGLHIALFAGFGVLLVRGVWKRMPRLTLRWPAPRIEAIASLTFALAYAAISGLGLPTRRALFMIGVLLAANLVRRARAPVHGLAFAVIALLALDPLCVLSAGFWLSFMGVAWLMFCLGGRGQRHRWWHDMISAQGVATIGLLPLTIWFFGQSSLIGPIANLLAVPVVCFIVLPLGVSGAVLQSSVPVLGVPLLKLAGVALQWLWWALERMASWPGAMWYFPEPSAWALVLAMLGAAWLLMPRGIPLRVVGIALFLPLLVPARSELAEGEFEALLLDVGQGLSVVVRTRDHALVYDAGARFPSGFDLGEVAVVPALRARGVDQIDRLIVSHGDNDHAGGAAAVLAAFPHAAVSSGEPERLPMPAAQCLAGEVWQWNGVTFRVVHPHVPLVTKDNDRCCVLEVRTGDDALVLTGDITTAVEGEVVAALGARAAHTVVTVPHHGSKTSSSASFIDALRPQLALVSSGYRNHFNHPNPAIVARYRHAGVPLLDTPESGFIALRFSPAAAVRTIERGRIDRHPYWRE